MFNHSDDCLGTNHSIHSGKVLHSFGGYGFFSWVVFCPGVYGSCLDLGLVITLEAMRGGRALGRTCSPVGNYIRGIQCRLFSCGEADSDKGARSASFGKGNSAAFSECDVFSFIVVWPFSLSIQIFKILFLRSQYPKFNLKSSLRLWIPLSLYFSYPQG